MAAMACPRLLLPMLCLAALPAMQARAQAAAADSPATAVTIYRCVDDKGRLVALRDSPCLAGERQETLQMQRPQDPPPQPPVAAPAPAAAPPPEREVRIVTVQPPQPMYECTDPDGQTYTSESADGNPRWVPLWTVGVPVRAHPRPQPRPPVRPAGQPSGPSPGPGPDPGPGVRPPAGAVALGGGTWLRDPCIRLEQEEICQRLSDRRYEILRVYHAAMPSGRAELDREQRQIDARMANDCPGT